MKKTVVVAGDLIWDHNLVQTPNTVSSLSELRQQTMLYYHAGGAWYLEDMVGLACADLGKQEKVNIVGVQREERLLVENSAQVSQAYSIWSPYAQHSEKNEKEKVWRVSQFLGCQWAAEESPPVPMREDVSEPDLLVLDDLGLGFRQFTKLWPAALQAGGKPKAVVLKTALPLQGPLWEKLYPTYADHLTVVLSVAALRERGAAISRSLSWDQTIEETIQEFEKGLSAQDLSHCRRVLVHFGVAGAASFTRCRPLPREQKPLLARVRFERFLYHPGELEGDWLAKRLGATFGATALLTAAVVRHELHPQDYPLYIALGRGLAAMRVNHELGGGEKESQIKQMFHPSEDRETPESVYCTAYPHSLFTDSEWNEQVESKSDLLRDLTGTGLEYVAAKATDVVLRGLEAALRAAPKARYGKYLTVDREEIERINSVRNLILSYRENLEDRRPLSIAVFGPPGSGKSFAIKELAAELLREKKSILEFNLSQFQSVHDLHTAFHQVHDESVRSQIPLVFWDEFDTALGEQSLGWLKEFLAPMQDAKFQAGSLLHPLGKAIFVFAGGTCSDFQSFDKSSDAGKEGKEFRAVKGPDFISRLRGFVNIKGPNPLVRDPAMAKKAFLTAEGLAEQDVAHLIRRAVLLRSVLEKSYSNLIDKETEMASISPGVIRGFLRVEKFNHGARSLEAIVHMSNLTQVRYFGVAELPPADLLRLHVTEDFLEQMREGQLEVAAIEALAEAFHERWCKQRRRQGWTYNPIRNDTKKEHPLLVPYAKLSEPDKERNRLPARLTQAKLLDVGYRIERLDGASHTGSIMHRFGKAAFARLMEIEHDIWLRDHLLDGYEWAEESKDHLRLHRDIVPFKNVPAVDKKLDRGNIVIIPYVLRKLGYTLVKK